MRTTAEMREAFTARANAAGLNVHCAMDGSLSSAFAVVSEAPGISEISAGLPLIGASGTFLWNSLRPHGLTRAQFYITNVCKRRLVEDEKVAGGALARHELEHWIGLLQWELIQLPNLRVVYALGNMAIKALTGHDGVTSWRGSVLDAEIRHGAESRMIKVVCGFNPTFPLREPKNEVIFALDCAKLKRVITGEYKPHAVLAEINPSARRAIDFLRGLRADRVPVATDIETIGGETACIGFANSPHEGMCIAFRDIARNLYDTSDEVAIRQEVQRLFADPTTRLIGQNGMFDSAWLWYKDKLRIRQFWFDTMLAHHTLFPPLPHNLGFITTQYTNHPYYKDDKDTWREGGDIDAFWRYNVTDCCMTKAASVSMLEELRQLKLERFFFEHVMRAQPHLCRMTVGGIKIDQALKAKLSEELTIHVDRLRNEFYAMAQELTGAGPEYEPNPNSPKQMSELLFSKLKLVGRGASTDKTNRELMHNHPRTPEPARALIRGLDAYLKEQKFLSTYISAGYDPDGRMRCEYKQTGVVSAPGRLSSAAVWWGTGMNFQNQTERSEAIFIADDGYCFVYFDLSQAEARVVGWLANITTWKHQFEQARLDGKYDCHRALAAEMFGIPYDQVPTKDRDEHGVTKRFVAKRCRHGLNYRMAADRLSLTTGLSRSDAYEAYEKYHRINPELRKWWAAEEAEVRANKVLYNAYGRCFRMMERITPEALESIIAFKPQSTIGDKVTRAIYRIHDDPKWPRSARVVLNIHDALIGLCRIEDYKRCLNVMRVHAEEPVMINGEQLIIPMEPGVSKPDELGIHRWSTIKKIDRQEIL